MRRSADKPIFDRAQARRSVKASEAMSATNLNYTEKSRAAEQRAHEPSMEEILASIRRIIADDQPLTRAGMEAESRIQMQTIPAEPVEAAALAPTVYQPAVYQPTVSVAPMASTPASPAAPMRAVEADFAPRPAAPNYDPPGRAAAPEPMAALAPAVTVETPLVSAATDASVSTAFQALAATRMMPSNEELDEIVRDMLRPMLKSWLDDNLPVMVERLVRAEIERVARGGR